MGLFILITHWLDIELILWRDVIYWSLLNFKRQIFWTYFQNMRMKIHGADDTMSSVLHLRIKKAFSPKIIRAAVK